MSGASSARGQRRRDHGQRSVARAGDARPGTCGPEDAAQRDQRDRADRGGARGDQHLRERARASAGESPRRARPGTIASCTNVNSPIALPRGRVEQEARARSSASRRAPARRRAPWPGRSRSAAPDWASARPGRAPLPSAACTTISKKPSDSSSRSRIIARAPGRSACRARACLAGLCARALGEDEHLLEPREVHGGGDLGQLIQAEIALLDVGDRADLQVGRKASAQARRVRPCRPRALRRRAAGTECAPCSVVARRPCRAACRASPCAARSRRPRCPRRPSASRRRSARPRARSARPAPRW